LVQKRRQVLNEIVRQSDAAKKTPRTIGLLFRSSPMRFFTGAAAV